VNPVIPTIPPDCSKAATVLECLAFVIAGFKAQNPAVAGMGYQAPGACAFDPLWPTWIRPSDIPAGLVTKPCA
jgi:hypothetical protein